ncbi:MAG: hypothetical protein ACRD16_09605, partial [Thermoanaerobaculia bacterium]
MSPKLFPSALCAFLLAGFAFAESPGVQPPLTLSGKPFPDVARYKPAVPKPTRTLFVKASKDNGDGSEKNPWNDLQAALCELRPGDRLRVGAGTYTGPF